MDAASTNTSNHYMCCSLLAPPLSASPASLPGTAFVLQYLNIPCPSSGTAPVLQYPDELAEEVPKSIPAPELPPEAETVYRAAERLAYVLRRWGGQPLAHASCLVGCLLLLLLCTPPHALASSEINSC